MAVHSADWLAGWRAAWMDVLLVEQTAGNSAAVWAALMVDMMDGWSAAQMAGASVGMTAEH